MANWTASIVNLGTDASNNTVVSLACVSDDIPPRTIYPPNLVLASPTDADIATFAQSQVTLLANQDAARAALKNIKGDVDLSLAPKPSPPVQPLPPTPLDDATAAQLIAQRDVLQWAGIVNTLLAAGVVAGDPTLTIAQNNLAAAQDTSAQAITALSSLDPAFATLAKSTVTVSAAPAVP